MSDKAGAKPDAAIIEKLVLQGDLAGLTAEQKVAYYGAVCDSLGLNPLTKPFDILTLGGKQILYAKKDATDQLRKLHVVSVTDLDDKVIGDMYRVFAKVIDKEGRTDAASGVVNVAGLRGDALANAMMKAETKAKRRATLSICGLGILDESEIETIPDAQRGETRVVSEMPVANAIGVAVAAVAPPPLPAGELAKVLAHDIDVIRNEGRMSHDDCDKMHVELSALYKAKDADGIRKMALRIAAAKALPAQPNIIAEDAELNAAAKAGFDDDVPKVTK